MYNILFVIYYFVVYYLFVIRDFCSMLFYQLFVIFFSLLEFEVFVIYYYYREGAIEDGVGDGQRFCFVFQRCSQFEVEFVRGKGFIEYSFCDLVSLR